MHITFHGAAQTVTGSRHLIDINGSRVLLDCGLYQGRRKETYRRNLNFHFEPSSVDAVILSHAHIDHSGNLPNFVKHGYEGPIYCTHATAHLTDIMMRDSAHIQESDVEYINYRRARRGEPPIEPLYTSDDAQRAAEFLIGQDYASPFEPLPGVIATLVEAGHILGSAGIILELGDRRRNVRIMFSGDIGRKDLPILRDPVLPQDIDYLIMECTYGDRSHNPPEQAYEQLRAVISRTVERGGKVVIPAFAVGRTQTLVYYLHQMIEHRDIPRIPIFVDSPLAINVTDIFRAHPECYDDEMVAFLEDDTQGTAFGFDLLSYTRTVRESKAINEMNEPMVIISASGMAEVGRILHHLHFNIEQSRNTVLITSWMAPHTLGRRLLEGKKKVKIFGEKHRVNAEVVVINGLSAHADQDYLLTYALSTRDRIRRIFLVHGEQEPAQVLTKKLAEAGLHQVHYPKLAEVVEI